MGLIKTKKGYLFFTIVSFILSIYGFAGMIEGRGREVSPIYFGCLFLFSGAFFYTAILNKKTNNQLKSDTMYYCSVVRNFIKWLSV